MATTPLQGWTIPANSDSPLGGTQFATAMGAAEKQSVMTYASASARNTALPAGSCVEGMLAYLRDVDQMTMCTVTGAQTWATITDAAAWTTYTPAFSTSGSAAVSASGNRIGRWRQTGGRVTAELYMTWVSLGAGEGLGSGDYYWGLPVACNAWYPANFSMGVATFFDSGLALYSGTAALLNSSNVLIPLGAGNKCGSAAPVVPTNGDAYYLRLDYYV